MKPTSIKMTFITAALALIAAPPLHSYPASFAKLKKDGVTIALIGDEHTRWTKDISLEPPYLKALEAWLAKLKDKKTPTHFILELTPSKDSQARVLYEFNTQPKAQDSLSYLQCFAINNKFTDGSIQFNPADIRVGAMRTAIDLFASLEIEEERCKNGFPNIRDLQSSHGKITFNDFLSQCNTMYNELVNKAEKFTFSAAALKEIGDIKASYEQAIQLLKAGFQKADKQEILGYLHSLCAYSQGKIIPQFNQIRIQGIIPALGALGDLHFTWTILEAAPTHKHIVAYVGANHVARAIAILQGAGFELQETVGEIRHNNRGGQPLDLEVLTKVLSNAFADNKEELKEVKADTAAKEEGKVSGATHVGAGSAGAGDKATSLSGAGQGAGVASATESTKAITCNNPGCTITTGPKQFVCSICKKEKYCSAACQRAHWPTHKPSCKKA